jgi:hypothetical protein
VFPYTEAGLLQGVRATEASPSCQSNFPLRLLEWVV